MSEAEKGVALTLGTIVFAVVMLWAGWQLGVNSVTASCQRFGEFDRIAKTYTCVVKP